MTEWNRRLTDDEVRKIREMRNAGAPQGELAAMFKVSQAHVSHLVRGKRRKDAGGPLQEGKWSK